MRGQGQSPKVQRFKAPSSTCTHSREVDAVPPFVVPAVAPAPLVAEIETADAQVAIAVAIDSTPEEDVAGVPVSIRLPLIWNEFGMREQVVEDVGVKDGLLHQLLAELVAFDDLAILLAT